MPRSVTPSTAPITPSGTTRITASGMVQLSYSAASAKNTISTDKANSAAAWLPDSRSSYDWPDQSKPMPRGSSAANSSMARMASPLLCPLAADPLIVKVGKPL
ncbi:hypothetical protein G6F68_017943 [Rhizopus microsporus]|nr:hypothetical protein G6F68_017943 [Rhizopus microsporus]